MALLSVLAFVSVYLIGDGLCEVIVYQHWFSIIGVALGCFMLWIIYQVLKGAKLL